MKKLASLFLVALFVTTSFHANAKSIQQTLQDELIDIMQSHRALLSSFMRGEHQFEYYGNEPVSEELRVIIEDACKQFKIDSSSIEWRMAKPGKGNRAFSTHNAIFFDKEWFSGLTDFRKRLTVGHEMVHVIKNHVVKRFIFNKTTLAALIGVMIAKSVSFSDVKMYFLLVAQYLCTLAYIREQEKEADILSAQTLKLHIDPDLVRRVEKRTVGIWDWFGSWFKAHPTYKEQIAYLDKECGSK